MSKDKITRYCNKIIELSLYAIAFYIPISTALIESFIGLAIVSWLVKKAIAKTKFKDIFYPTSINIQIFFYLLVCVLSSIFSSSQTISFKHLIFKTTEYLLLFFIIVEIVDKIILRNILITMVFSVGIVGIDGIFQYFTHFDFLRHRVQIITVRINGPFRTPNDFSNYLVSILPLVSSLCFIKFRNLLIKPTLIIHSLIIFICLIIAATRSAWIAFLLTMPLVAILGNRKLFFFALLLIVITLSLLPLLPSEARSCVTHFFYINDPRQLIHRQILWKIGLNMFIERPILGQGIGTFMYNFDRFKPKDYNSDWGISYAHNCFIQIASETGILGLLSFILIIVVLFFVSFKFLRKIRTKHFYYILSGLLSGIFAYLVSSFFDTNLYSLPLTVLFWFMVGLSVAVIKIVNESSEKV